MKQLGTQNQHVGSPVDEHSEVKEFKMRNDGPFLAVQCLRFHTPNAGGLDSIPSPDTRSCMLLALPKKKKIFLMRYDFSSSCWTSSNGE